MKVTDEMVHNAVLKFKRVGHGHGSDFDDMKAALEASLADVPDPRVPLTHREMMEARRRAEHAEAKLTNARRHWRVICGSDEAYRMSALGRILDGGP